MDVIKNLVANQIKTDVPEIPVGATVKVHVKIKEGNRERIQIFEGFVLKRQNGGIAEYLHRYGQKKAMREQGWTADEFCQIFGKNYLE